MLSPEVIDVVEGIRIATVVMLLGLVVGVEGLVVGTEGLVVGVDGLVVGSAFFVQ